MQTHAVSRGNDITACRISSGRPVPGVHSYTPHGQTGHSLCVAYEIVIRSRSRYDSVKNIIISRSATASFFAEPKGNAMPKPTAAATVVADPNLPTTTTITALGHQINRNRMIASNNNAHCAWVPGTIARLNGHI